MSLNLPSLPLIHSIVVKNKKNTNAPTKENQIMKSKKQVLKPNLPTKQIKELKKVFSTQGTSIYSNRTFMYAMLC